MNNYPKIDEIKFKAFGTEINIQIIIENDLGHKKALGDFEKIKRIYIKNDLIFSRFKKNSELMILNGNLNKFQKASFEMIDVIKRSLIAHKKTSGYFDPRIIDIIEKIGYDKNFEDINANVKKKKIIFNKNNDIKNSIKIRDDEVIFSDRMDFSGIVKGYVGDRVAEFLYKEGWKNFCVDLGGDMFFAGKSIDNEKWLIDVEGFPYQKLMFFISNCAIATSGIAKRRWEIGDKKFHHLINPKNENSFSFDIKSVTVIENILEDADVYAKTIFLMDGKERKEFINKNKIACAILNYNGNIWLSSYIKKYIYKKI